MMRHQSLPFLISLVITALLAASCQKKETIDIAQTDFVYVEGNGFKLHGDTFFPVMLNYIVSFQETPEGGFLVSPSVDYDSIGYVEARGREAVREQLDGHFQLIKEMGFNTLRICFDRTGQDEKGYYYHAGEKKFRIGNSRDECAIIDGMKEFLDIAAAHDLHVMLLIKCPIYSSEIEKFTIRMLSTFQDCPTLFAYDFMNEPLYFDPVEKRKKKEAKKLVTHWKEMMTKYAPCQLLTIGFSEPIEVFEWDASMLPVDFVEIHTYHPLRVASEIYWYSKYVGKPWMVGETGLPADGDSISYEEQAEFLRETYRLVRDAGGCGYGWWEYQEFPGAHFEAQYTGLLNHTGRTTTADGKHTLYGTLKPAGRCLPQLADYEPKPMERPVNYYNMLGYKNIRITGTIIDQRTKKPIEGAVIRGWNEWWSVGMNTYSDENGRFTLYSNDECVHFEISAPGKSKVKFNKQLTYSCATGEKFNANSLPDRMLEYHQISHYPFLDCSDTTIVPVLQFRTGEFNQYKWSGEMGTVMLRDE